MNLRHHLQRAGYLTRHFTLAKALRDKLFLRNLHADWPMRRRLAVTCRDNLHIERVPGAGDLENGVMTTHSGLKILAESYYGQGNADLMAANRGVHEPQEEYVFQEVLRRLDSGSNMLELGAYWGYYSLWFLQAVKDGQVYLVEPETENLEVGRRNFSLNGCRGDFTQALVGAAPDPQASPPQISVDSFLRDRKIAHLTILHSDIQGYEVAMLQGARDSFASRRVDYVFISTHGIWLHLECLEFLRHHDYVILASADKFESYSLDGLIVARRRELFGCPPIQISRR